MPMIPAEDPTSGLGAEAVFGCQESLLAKPSPHDTPPALSPSDGSMFEGQESSPAEHPLINPASSLNTETASEDQVLSLVSYDCPTPGLKANLALEGQDPARAQIMPSPAMSETGPRRPPRTSPATLALLNEALDRIQMMAIREDPPSACVQQPLDMNYREFYKMSSNKCQNVIIC